MYAIRSYYGEGVVVVVLDHGQGEQGVGLCDGHLDHLGDHAVGVGFGRDLAHADVLEHLLDHRDGPVVNLFRVFGFLVLFQLFVV